MVSGVADGGEENQARSRHEPDTQMGPLVSEEQLNRVCGYLESGRNEGAKAVVGGKRAGDRGYFVKPTVLVNTKPGMKVVKEEIFGPVVCAVPFADPTEVVHAGEQRYGLAAAVWTRDIAKAHRWRPSCARGPSGSIATTSLTPRCLSAATNNPAGAARWAPKRWSFTPRPKRSACSCELTEEFR